MEPRFDADFSSVRVHVDSEAADLSSGLHARAFTHGTDVYFGSGAYDPGSRSGRHLIAHELTHVYQQAGAQQARRQLLSRRRAAPGVQHTAAGADDLAHDGGMTRVQRQMLDPALEDEVFEIEAAKRQAEVANINMGRSQIGPQDRRRQGLEAFFSDPAHQKGNRSYPAVGPGQGGPRAGRAGSPPATTLPNVLVVGSDPSVSARLPEQATGEHEIQGHFDALTGPDPTLIPLLRPIRLAALAALQNLGRHGIRKVTHGAGQADDAAKLAQKVKDIVEAFKRDTARIVEQRQWQGTVAARDAFVASKPNQPMATRALERAKQDIAQAGAIYQTLYEVLGFDEARISRLATTSSEAAMLDLHTVIVPAAWAEFLTAVTKSDALLAFALTHKAALSGLPNAASIVEVWEANPTSVTSAADANNILALALVNHDVANGVAAAALLGTPQVPDIATLQAVSAGGQITSVQNLKLYTGVGGDLLATKGMRSLPGAARPTLDDIKAFNLKAGRKPVEAWASWAALQKNVADDQKKFQIIKSVVKAPNATCSDFTRLVTNWAALSDRTTIDSTKVASLVLSGLLLPRGKVYDSGTWGKGAVYVFELAGQGRLEPEWHLHFQAAGAKTTVAGAGWKNKDEKYGTGVKTFGSAPVLEKAIRDVGQWKDVKI